MYLEMKVYGFALDPIAQMPVVILKGSDGEQSVPIWIGAAESVAFAAEFIGKEVSVRNGRKDMLSALLDRLGMSITRIAIEGVADGVFDAVVQLKNDEGEELELDLHVSEAMLLSLRYRLPVMVNEEIISEVSTLEMSQDAMAEESNARRFVDFLDQLDPSAMGKYPM